MVLPAAVPAVLVPGDQTPADVAAQVAVILAVQLAAATRRVPAVPGDRGVTALPVLAAPGAPATAMIAAAISPAVQVSPETTALGRDATTGQGQEATTAPPRGVTTDRVRAATTRRVRAVKIDQLRVVMTDQLRAGTTATYRVGEGTDGRPRAGRTAPRQKTGSRRCGTTRVPVAPRVARARKPVALAATTEAPLIVGRVVTTGVRLIALLVGMTEVPRTAGRDVTIGLLLGVMTGPGRVVTTGPVPGGTIVLPLGVMTGPDRDETTGPDRAGTTGPGRRVRLGAGGGRIAVRVVAIALRERSV